MSLRKIFMGFVVVTVSMVFASMPMAAEKFDYAKVKDLKGMELIEYFNGLGLKGQEALDFWKNIP